MIRRKLEKVLKKAAGNNQVLSVMGPRQSGKTTLVKMVFPDYSYINLEYPSLRRFASEDPVSFIKNFGNRIIIDETQYVPSLFSYIQLSVDQDRQQRFILTGSQNFHLYGKISQSLAGRVAMFSLLPFSVEEMKGSAFEHKEYESYLVKGFYPRIYDRKLNALKWLNDYVLNYIERDVRQLQNIGDLNKFGQFLKLCAGSAGQLVNFSSFGNEMGISYHTAQSWLSVLEASFIVFRLYPYHNNFKKRMIKTPKLYFYDTGLASSLLGIKSAAELQLHFAKGSLFENMIIADILKNSLNRGLKPDVYFWRDSTGNEVDLILDDPGGPVAVEIKSGRTIDPGFFKNLNYWRSLHSGRESKEILVYGGDLSQTRSNTKVLSWDKLTRI